MEVESRVLETLLEHGATVLDLEAKSVEERNLPRDSDERKPFCARPIPSVPVIGTLTIVPRSLTRPSPRIIRATP